MEERKILHFKDTTDTYVKQIDIIINNSGVGLCSFILTSCLIDTLSYYSIDEEKNSERYKGFIKKYLVKSNPKYGEGIIMRRIYESVRCSVVHSFSISGGVILGEAIPNMHLQDDFHGNLIIDLGQFYQDIKKSIKEVYKDLDRSGPLQKLFNKRYQKMPPFEVYRTVEMWNGKSVAVSGITSLPVDSYKVINYGRRKNYG